MEKDFTVRIETKMPDDNIRVDVYRFGDYTWHGSQSLKQMLYEFEDLVNKLEGVSSKDEWRDSTKASYAKIRKRVLDAANAIGRLPKTLCYKGMPCCNIEASEMLASIIDRQ